MNNFELAEDLVECLEEFYSENVNVKKDFLKS
jgi:hypothetical protein